jgi:hypothetical protein
MLQVGTAGAAAHAYFKAISFVEIAIANTMGIM